MHIIDQFATGKPTVSMEFFPAAEPAAQAELMKQIQLLAAVDPDFVSVTYGAGGGTRDRTFELVTQLRELRPIPHLTCIGHTQREIRGILTHYATAGVRNLLAMRGDPPRKGLSIPGEFPHAVDLVRFIRKFSRHSDPRGFGIGVAGFPEGHPGTPNRIEEMDHLKAKVDAGADYICTQLFFDNHDFHDFRGRCELAGIDVPIIAGILPLTSLGSIRRISGLAAGARIPARLLRALQRVGTDAAAVRQIGIHHAAAQCSDLLDHRVAGLHFYTLNHADATLSIIERLGLAPAVVR